jgi:hypothetical protein
VKALRWWILWASCALSACSEPATLLPVVEPGPQPAPSPLPAPEIAPATPDQIGSFPAAPAPRYGVAIFAFPREGSPEAAAHSPEWTARVATLIELQRLGASTLTFTDPLGKDLEQEVARLAASPEAKAVDVLVAGTVTPGGITQLRLLAHDTGKQRGAAKSFFEGLDAGKVLEVTLSDLLKQVHRYWFELDRGENSEVILEVRGLTDPRDIAKLQEALAALPGVRVTRREALEALEGKATVTFKVFLRGDPAAFVAGAAGTEVQSARRRLRLRQAEGLRFDAIYE